MCSTSRSHVVWTTSDASLSTSLKSLVIDQMSLTVLIHEPVPRGGVACGGAAHHLGDADRSGARQGHVTSQ